jgi:hypothetical protein
MNMPEPQVGTYTGELVVLQYRGASDRAGQPVNVQDGWGSLCVLCTSQLEVTHRLPHSPTVMSTHFETTDLRSFFFEAAEQPRMYASQDWHHSASTEQLTGRLENMRLLPTANSPFMIGLPRLTGSCYRVSTDANVLICERIELERYLPTVLTHIGVYPEDIELVKAYLQMVILMGDAQC